jgi:hypothetical protein
VPWIATATKAYDNDSKLYLIFLLGESSEGLFIGVVRSSGNNVRMTLLTTLFTHSVQSKAL